MEDIFYYEKLDYRIENIGFVNVERTKNYTFEFKEGKPQFSFIYVESGSLEYSFTTTKQKIHIPKGYMLFIPKNLPYIAKYLENGTKIKIFVFDCPGQNQNILLKVPFYKSLPEISAVFDECLENKTRNSLFLYSKLYELLYVLQKITDKSDKKYQKILPAIKELKQNFSQNHKISYYAELCSMSESNFRKLFKECTGKSPIDFRNTIRIREVKRMLDSGEYRISEAAYAVGFNNMSFFYEIYEK